MTFQIHPLPREAFEPVFGLSDEALKAQGIVPRIADAKPGFPCRVSLKDAEPGERVLLLNFEHQSADTPYQSRYAVYVRDGAEQARLAPGEVPELLRTRTLAARGFSERGMLINADLCEGVAVDGAIEALFDDPRIAYIHLHYAKPGCFAARVDRGPGSPE